MPIPTTTPTVIPYRLTPATSQAPTVLPYHVPGSNADRVADTARTNPTVNGTTVRLAENPLLVDQARIDLERRLVDVDAQIAQLTFRLALVVAARDRAAASVIQLSVSRGELLVEQTLNQSTSAARQAEFLSASTQLNTFDASIAAVDADIRLLDQQIAAIDAVPYQASSADRRAALVADLDRFTAQRATLVAYRAEIATALTSVSTRLAAVDAAIAAIDAAPATPTSAAERAVLAGERTTLLAQRTTWQARDAAALADLSATDAEITRVNAAIAAIDAAAPQDATNAGRRDLLDQRQALAQQRAALDLQRVAHIRDVFIPARTNLIAVSNLLGDIAAGIAAVNADIASETARRNGLILEASALQAQLITLSGERSLLATQIASLGAPAAVTLEMFLAAHSGHQLEYLARNGNVVTLTSGGDSITFVRSTDGERVINVNALRGGSASSLSKEDQELVAGTQAFRDLAAQIGLLPDASTVVNPGQTLVETARNVARAQVQSFIDRINGTAPNPVRPWDSAGPLGERGGPGDRRQIFVDQLENMLARIDDSGIFDLETITAKATAIERRSERQREFALVLSRYKGLNLFDDATLEQGFNSFLAEERRILDADNRMTQIIRLQRLGVPTLDLPALIVELQMLYEEISNAIRDQETEDVRQHNALLRDYATMQGFLGTTISNIDPSEATNTGTFGFSPDNRIVRMFSTSALSLTFNGNQAVHPVEWLNGLTEPRPSRFQGQARRDQWENVKNQLQDRVTTLNQNSELRQNEINQRNSQANRHFEIVNNTLRRTFDILQTIGRSTA